MNKRLQQTFISYLGADVQTLMKYATPLYNPRKNPSAMCIGVENADEAHILRRYHEEQYGTENLRIAACNIETLRPDPTRDAIYDYCVFNRFKGDARFNHPFFDALREFGGTKFDFVYIRNPMIADFDEWNCVFRRSLEWTTRDGAVVTIIRESDVHDYRSFLDMMEGYHGIRPKISCPTNVHKDNEYLDNLCHTIGVFKPKTQTTLEPR